MPLNKPQLNHLMEKVDSKYTLIVLAAKRARYLIETDDEVLHDNKTNPVSVALKNIMEDEVNWRRVKNDIK